MKISIDFNENVYRNQMDLLFDLAYKPKLNYNKNSHLFGLGLIIFSIALILDRPNIFAYFLLFFGVILIFQYFNLVLKIRRIRKKFEKEKEIECEKFKGVTARLEFLDDVFVFNDDIQEIKFKKWDEFETWILKDETLFMFTRTHQPFIISEIEVGKEIFDSLIEFTKSKVSSRVKTAANTR